MLKERVVTSVVISMVNFKPVKASIVSRSGYSFKVKRVSPSSVVRLKRLTYKDEFTSEVINRRNGLKLVVKPV